jgi:hypothetical protein
MSKGLKIAPPPRRIHAANSDVAPTPTPKFDKVKETERVQFNKRVTRGVADGFELLAIKSRRRIPDLLAEALEILQERYGRV